MIYADYNGSSLLNTEVKQYLLDRLEKNGPYGNPNSSHFHGVSIMGAMNKARNICAEVLGAKPEQLIFNSGATEGISNIFHSILNQNELEKKNIIIVSGIEHASIYNNLKYFESKGYLVQEIKTESNGVINLSHLSELIEKYNRNIALVTAMAANNESGVIQPYKEISSLCHEHNIEYFCDSTQIIGKAPFSFQESNADYAVLSGHKIGALPGTGLMLIKNPDQFFPMIIGSGQEGGLRGGTQNYLGNETLAVALNYFNQNLGKLDQLQKYRNYFEQKLQNDFPELVIIGQNGPRLAGTSFLCHPGIHGQAIQIELESDDIFITTSSACSDNEPMTSKVLKSMGVNDKLGRSAIRISLSTSSTEADYESIYQSLKKAYLKLSEIKSF